MSQKTIVSVVGCCLVDMLLNDGRDTIRPYLTKKRDKGGLTSSHFGFQVFYGEAFKN